MTWRRQMGILAFAVSLATLPVHSATAHPLSPSLLDLRENTGGLVDVTWTTPSGRPLARSIAPILPSECLPIGPPREERSQARVTHRVRLRCRGGSLVGKVLRIEGLDRSKTSVIARVTLADGRRVEHLLTGDTHTFRIPHRRGAARVAADYIRLGIEHIFSGVDHLLFVLTLVLLTVSSPEAFMSPPCKTTRRTSDRAERGDERGRRPEQIGGELRRPLAHRRIVTAVTAFTAGHSITLTAAFLGYVHFPTRLIESGIAFSIAVLAAELARPPEISSALRARPWTGAFGFGLLHGFGFAGALSATGLSTAAIPFALASFNIGIELGQLAFVGTIVALLTAVRICGSSTARAGPAWLPRVPAYAIGTTAAFWTIERLVAGL